MPVLAASGPDMDRAGLCSGWHEYVRKQSSRYGRGPTLVFAHNSHLRRGDSALPGEANWAAAGALVAHDLGDEYVFIATDANPSAPVGTLQAMLADATDRRALFPADALTSALPESVTAGTPIAPGHLPLSPADLSGTDAIVFIADTDGHRRQYW